MWMIKSDVPSVVRYSYVIIIINMAAADQERHDSTVRPRSYKDFGHRHGFLGTVGELQKAGVLQDVILEVEERQFPCHRLVLSVASPYFRAMFTSDMAESRQKTVVLQGLDAGIFGEILSYIYSGTLHVSLDTVQPLYQAADLLQLDYVKVTCSSYMAMNLERSTCVDLYRFADAFSADMLLISCRQWICRHFAEFVSSEEFCSLSVKQLTEIISHDELDVKEETTVWEAVVRWVQYSREDRLHHLPIILPHIRFNLLTSDDTVTAAILDHPLVREHPGSSELIRNVVQKGSSNSNLRIGMDSLEMALLFEKGASEILFMNPRVGKYKLCDYKNLPPIVTMTATSDNDIYVLAEQSQDWLFFLVYNHLENTWEQRASLLRAEIEECDGRVEHLVEGNGNIYYLACAESIDGVGRVVMEKYDRHMDHWHACSTPEHREPYTMTYLKAVFCGPHLYFIDSFEMHRYDPREDRWCRLTPLPRDMTRLWTAVAMGTEIYCTSLKLDKMFVYDTQSDTWDELPRWPNAEDFSKIDLSGPAVFILQSQLHILIRCRGNDGVLRKQIRVCDRSAGVWRDIDVPLPDDHWFWDYPDCPVARMYLPCLNGNHDDAQSTSSIQHTSD